MERIIINIGRQFGSGGRAVARVLGEKLGIPVYDHELLSRAAQESGFSRDLFKKSDEKRRRFSISGFFSGDNFVGDEAIFQMQSQTIRNIADQGSAVIIGRCADYVLRDYENVLNVFLTAPMEARIERVCNRMNVDKQTAREIIAAKDRNRPAYYNYFTFGNWGVASTYHLCLDSSRLGEEGTAELIIEYARKAGMIR